MRRGRAGALVVLTLAAAAAAALGADRKAPPWERRKDLGQDLYREHCAVCHEINKKQTKKFGPSLYHLFQNEKLPLSGGKPTREYVVVKIKFGGQLMPPFIKKMTETEVEALVDYIETK
jgi:mono/diheme cytochrome c family protein